ncbi:transglycosylase SLT domain-containing protein [Luteimonas sp BLCC-B24]|uniref:lytic transglycosylase domain-containing protein n=1 Tax=Luteimonas sp. BLCC-B24 TaxID=3025317 RepID=UPI00234DF563|nr:lytic transglycosylase domain-containing protein [Luteimonas sp. BLCC-B24]MDC7805595.1 transglycosylase SLT domain-containing protein [Luteimonas sp. BLCC-B24]
MRARPGTRLAAALLLAAMPALPLLAGPDPGVAASNAAVATAVTAPAAGGPTVRNGQDIYRRFLDGLADQDCSDDASARWRSHFGHVPRQLTSRNNDVLPLFGYVVDAMREAHLPTEYALIPFIESGYRPGARSASGPAGLWQFIAVTARNHEIPIRPGYDGRLSPADATTAAVRYLKTLHGMFAGDWRLAVMAYNAGEYRVLNALKRAGQAPAAADPAALAMPDITHSYVRKLHALSCVIKEAETREGWMAALDRDVPILQAIPVPDGIRDLDTLASRHETDAQQLRRLNPAHSDGRVARIGQPVQVLVPQAAAAPPVFMAEAPPEADRDEAVGAASDIASAVARRVHTVVNGDSIWAIARQYGVSTRILLERNGLDARSILRPGMELRIDGAP